jgi:hypothetical protein
MTTAAAVLTWVFVTAPVRGDSWALPQNRKVKSANGKFTALVIPADRFGPDDRPRKPGADEHHARVNVYEGEPGADGKWNTIWSVTLTSEVAPCEVFLSNDGEYLATLDNWHSFGRGIDTVAFYERVGERGSQLAQYATRDFLAADEEGRVPMSVSSSWWREWPAMLDESAPDGARCLCVRLSDKVARRWVAWDVTTGKAVAVDAGGALEKRFEGLRAAAAAAAVAAAATRPSTQPTSRPLAPAER